MPSWVVGVVGTFALSLILAYGFLRLRCRGVGNPFGRRAKSWAVLIMLATAIVSTGVGLLLVAASRHLPAAYVGVVVPGGLWFSKLPPQRDRDLFHRTLAGVLTLPFSRLYDRMGDDMEALVRDPAASGVGEAAVDRGRRDVLLQPGTRRTQGPPGPGRP